MNILQVSATDFGGGAAKVAWDLHKAYQQQGCDSWLAVGKKKTGDASVFQVPNDEPQNYWETANFAVASQTKKIIGIVRGAGLVSKFFESTARYRNMFAYIKGQELFDYPGTKKLLQLPPEQPDILHCHNLHSKYFDLRLLPNLSNKVPTVLTLHDTWLLSGHCAYSVTCNRWKSGCGSCPDLSLYPAVSRDNTAENWRLKKSLYAKSKLYVVTPCAWLMNKVEASMLQPGIRSKKIINNGVDVDFFCPGDKALAREALGLNQEEFILLFVANSVRNNIWKDFSTLKKALELLSATRRESKIRLICFGDDSPSEKVGQFSIDFISHTDDLCSLVNFYQAADLYVHATKADTFPTVILEALACGLPVIATAVDGVSEQINSLTSLANLEPFMKSSTISDLTKATGVLVARADSAAIAHWVEKMMDDRPMLKILSSNARVDALKRFDFRRQVNEYLEWYEECLKDFKERSHAVSAARPM
jgi:glycosyltransferase involved in cell wall biosynthesis